MKPENDILNRLFLEYKNSGSEETFNQVKKSTDPWLRKMARHYIKNPDDIDDIIQNVWMKVFLKRNDFDAGIAGFKSWIFKKMLMGEILHYFRANKSKQAKFVQTDTMLKDDDVPDFLQNLPAERVSADDRLNKHEANWLIRKAMKNMDSDYQDVLILSFFGNKKLEEIANMMNKSPNTVRTWNSRAKAEISGKLRHYI